MWSLLISVSTEVEADIIKGLLDQSEILVQKKYPLGSLKDSYGIVNGVELWVPADDLDQARTLINPLIQNSEATEAVQDEDEDEVEAEQEPESMYKPNSTINHRAQSNLNVPIKSLFAILLALVLIIYWLIKGSEIF